MIITDISKLQSICEEVSLEEAPQIISILEQELKKSELNGLPGIGLAAPQVGINKRVAIIRIPQQKFKIDLINLKASDIVGYDRSIFEGEGCLSFPNQYKKTLRFNEVFVKNNQGTPSSFIATRLLAVAIQHEQDHLDGKLFFEHSIK
jgi:peptide deformylase